MIRSTFQLVPGVGPWRERQLWAAGITTWELPAAPVPVSWRGDVLYDLTREVLRLGL